MNNQETDYINILKGYNLLLYFAGSMVMNEPTEDCVIDFWMNGKLRNLPVSSTNPRFIKAAALLRESCPEKIKCKTDLSSDFKKLFSSGVGSLAPALRSNYPAITGASSGPAVSAYYDTYEFGSRFRGKVPDDHLGLELLFLTQMIDKLLRLDDEPCRREMQKEIERFIDFHLLSWIPQWNNDIQSFAGSTCYKAIGNLIYACTEDIKAFVSRKELLPRELKN